MDYIEYLNKYNKEYGDIFKRIKDSSTKQKKYILDCLNHLKTHPGLAYALMALYRQQVESGFVLADPLRYKDREEKKFFDHETGISFCLQWNPDRELRKNHELLIKRGVIAENIDKRSLVNLDENQRPCYLCKANIDIQNPNEILLPISLVNETYYAGANFAYITNNHFTLMSLKHRKQQYHKKIPLILNSFVSCTEGIFRAVFNSLAGASIENHEHMQIFTEPLPIEKIKINKKDIIYEKDGLRVSEPYYYLPVYIVEGLSKEGTAAAADTIIQTWHELDSIYHTENIITTMQDNQFRIFVLLRDKRRLIGKGKKGDMASFEAGGHIVLSYTTEASGNNEPDERKTFESADIESVKGLISAIAPEKRLNNIDFKSF